MKQKLLNHELKYISLFSKIKKYNYGYEAEDLQQRDKYYHNQLHLMINKFNVKDIDEYLSRNKQHGFAIYRVEGDLDINLVKKQEDIVSHEAIYGRKIVDLNVTKKSDVNISVVNPQKDTKFFEFLYEDSKAFGEDYAIGNVKRQKQVLSNNDKVYFYLQVTYEDQIVGTLNAFIDNDIAKLDDFTIKPNLQKQGFGSTLMREMLELLTTKGVKYVYLVTDQEDTPKDMYQKWGFKYISDYYIIRKTINE